MLVSSVWAGIVRSDVSGRLPHNVKAWERSRWRCFAFVSAVVAGIDRTDGNRVVQDNVNRYQRIRWRCRGVVSAAVVGTAKSDVGAMFDKIRINVNVCDENMSWYCQEMRSECFGVVLTVLSDML